MMQKLSARLVALLLLLSLFQKMGMELWLHHFFHEPPAKQRIAMQRIAHDHGPAVAPVHCSCLDDTLMPMVGADNVTLTVAVTLVRDRRSPAASALYYADAVHSALRGPPQRA